MEQPSEGVTAVETGTILSIAPAGWSTPRKAVVLGLTTEGLCRVWLYQDGPARGGHTWDITRQSIVTIVGSVAGMSERALTQLDRESADCAEAHPLRLLVSALRLHKQHARRGR